MRLPVPPFRLTGPLVRRLRRRADRARDAGAWALAAAFYEEALALGRRDGRLHVQCGHMWKEAGDLDRAGDHYAAAAALLPGDADLALQLGHYHKLADRPAEAADAYARALDLRPGWADAAAELARLRAGDPGPAPAPLPELLPVAGPPPGGGGPDGLVVHRFGAELVPGPGGVRRMLRGVQALRGRCRSTVPLAQLALLVDGREVARWPLAPLADDPTAYVFNRWFDFGTLPAGEAEADLHLLDRAGRRARGHRIVATLAPAGPAARFAGSDAWLPPLGPAPLDEAVAALPSMVRPARRRLFPDPRTILVQRVDQLGDLACSVPAIRRLRALFPAARLVGLLSHANAGLAEALGLFDAVLAIDFPERHGRRGLAAADQHTLAARLAAEAPDLAIDLAEAGDARPLLQLSGAPFLAGFDLRRFPWLSFGLELGAPDPLDRLESAAHGRKALVLVEALGALATGAAVAEPRPDPAADRALLAADGLVPDGAYVLLHTGARLAPSRWPGFGALVRLVLDRTALGVVLLADDAGGVPADLPDTPRLRIHAGRLPFDRFDALAGTAAAFVGNDSGPKHLAALRGVPVVSIHMARLNWSEWGQETTGVVVSRRVPCAGCGIAQAFEECGRDTECVTRITPDEVFAALLAVLPAG